VNVLGIDIGGTKIAARIVSDSLETLAERVVPTPDAAKPTALHAASDKDAARAAGRAAMFDSVIQLCRALDYRGHGVTEIGIGTAGQVDPVRGVIVDANENIVGWKGAPLAESIARALGITVYVDNDVRTMALAESTLGAGRGYAHGLYITVGTGIGGAIVLDGRLWRGAHYSAGEIGYLFGGLADDGQARSIEQLYAGAAVEHRTFDGTLTLREIADRAHAGDSAARAVIESAASALAVRLAPAIAFLDPEVVVIGGGVPQIGALWWTPFTETLQHFVLESVRRTPILKAALGAQAGVMGAALLALRKGH